MAAASRFVPMFECISSMQEFRVDTIGVKTLLSNVKELRGASGETAACLEQVFLQVEMKVGLALGTCKYSHCTYSTLT